MTAAIRVTPTGPLHLAEWCAPMRWRGICRYLDTGEVTDGPDDTLTLRLDDGRQADVVELWVDPTRMPEGRWCRNCTERLRHHVTEKGRLLDAITTTAP